MQETKTQQSDKQNYGYLGGDVSKGTCDFVLLNFWGNPLETNFQIDDNEAGHKQLFSLLQKWRKKHHLKKIIVGVESTGGYENNWYRQLQSKGNTHKLEVFRINPKRIYHESKTEGRISKSDSISAEVIAGYLRKNYGASNLRINPRAKNEQFASMRTLYKYIQKLIGQNTRTKNTLEKILYSFIPELLPFKGDKYSQWFLELLRCYPSRKKILEAGIEGLIKIKYLTTPKAEQIIKALKGSIGGTMDVYTKIALTEQVSDIQQVSKKIDRLKAQLAELAKEPLKEDIELLCSIKGIAEDSAISILIELEDVNRFEKAASLPAFWGVNPTIKQSGDKTTYTGMSKAGSPTARAALFTCASNVIIHEPYFKALYHKHRKNGKAHYQAIGVVMSKLARVVVGILKSKTVFDPGVDVYNQEKKTTTITTTITTTNCGETGKSQRRYQEISLQAPISNRQRKKRKQEQTASS